MAEVLEVYHRPYDAKRPQVCLDEGRKELRSTPNGALPRQPGQTACEDYEYQRHGACSYFLAIEPLAGWRRVWVTERRTLLDFAEVLRQLVDEVYPDAETIVLVTDNLNIHHPACLYERFDPQTARRIAAKLEWHYTPIHGSWLNIAEAELSVLERQCLKRRLPDIKTVTSEVDAWQTQRNDHAITVNWRFTTADARIKLKHLYPVFNVQKST